MIGLGAELRRQRILAGLSLRDVARSTKITDIRLGEIERGIKPMTDAELQRLRTLGLVTQPHRPPPPVRSDRIEERDP